MAFTRSPSLRFLITFDVYSPCPVTVYITWSPAIRIYKAESIVFLLGTDGQSFCKTISDGEILNIHISGSALWQMFEVVSACVVSSELISWLRQGRPRKSSFGRNFPLSGQQITTDTSMSSFLTDCLDSFFYFTFLLYERESLCFSCFALILSLSDWCTWNKNSKLHSFQSNSRWVHKKMSEPFLAKLES